MQWKISVVFSFFNEEDVLEELLQRMRAMFAALSEQYVYELIFVNDRSTDRSLDILTRHAKQDGRVKIVNMSRNFGVSECTLVGMKFASGDAVVIMDTYLQDPPEVIPLMIQKWHEEEADVVYTVRTAREGEPIAKKLAIKLGYKILHYISSIDLPVESGDFKLMTRRVVDQIIRLEETEPFLRGLVRWVGFKQVPVHYRREPRHAGDTHYIFYGSRVLKNFLSGVTSFSVVPLYLIFILGLIVSSSAFLFLIFVFVMKYLGWNLPGWSAIMATLLTFGGIQILSLGIIGLYISKIHIEVKRRPNFIVENTIGFEDKSVIISYREQVTFKCNSIRNGHGN
jgi:dolichol-phosphate mannosyltransferase